MAIQFTPPTPNRVPGDYQPHPDDFRVWETLPDRSQIIASCADVGEAYTIWGFTYRLGRKVLITARGEYTGIYRLIESSHPLVDVLPVLARPARCLECSLPLNPVRDGKFEFCIFCQSTDLAAAQSEWGFDQEREEAA